MGISQQFLTRFVTLQWRPRLAIGFCGMMGTLLPAAYGLATGIPEPRIQDEFSYLLSADTFAHGRLTNPAPALPNFFEAPHVLVVPTYSSKYPPGQGLAMALGQVLGGHPIWGVWLSCGLFAASVCWMLQAWTSRQWALATSLCGMITLGVSNYWAQSYWGGMVAASGGALLFGGMRRTFRSARVASSVLTALGVLILANSRPYEGLLLCLPVATILGLWLVRTHQIPLQRKLRAWMLPLGAVLLMGGVSMAVYNRAVTGDWARFPHAVHTAQYFHQGMFLFSAPHQPERTPVEHLAKLHRLYVYTPQHGVQLISKAASNAYARLPATITWSALGLGARSGEAPQSYLSAVLWILAVVAVSLADRWIWFCGATVLFVIIGQSLVWWWYPHYVAPLVSIVMAVVAVTLRRIASLTAPTDWLTRLAPAMVVLLAAIIVSLSQVPALYRVVTSAEIRVPKRPGLSPSPSDSSPNIVTSQSLAIRQLVQKGGFHLVFVRYQDDVPLGRQWVRNPADLSSARVIFAHDLGRQNNPSLVAAYPGRSVWLARVSKSGAQLEPYLVDEQLTRAVFRP